MSLERLYILLAKVLSKEANEAELLEFQSLISRNEEWKAVFHNLEELWATLPVSSETPSATDESYLLHLGRLKDQVSDFETATEPELVVDESEDFLLYPQKTYWYQKWQSYTAIAALFLFAFFGFNYLNKKEVTVELDKHFNEITVKLGTKTKVQLPDGSHVWVNSDSKLTYAETFSGPTRDIYLEGEAYFDVVKDAKHPFIVHTSGIDIKVLGTAFNVKAYKAEPTIEATLVHGLIEVTKTNQPEASKILLHPHEKLIFDKKANEQSVIKPGMNAAESAIAQDKPINPSITITPLSKTLADSALIETSWVYNRLSFEEEKFEDLAKKIERWFNVEITINNNKIRSYRTTGSFENETVDEALRELQYLVPFNYQINGRNIIITN
jgi:ferric-dicitrate binding protein FerR (iron transport regulator)